MLLNFKQPGSCRGRTALPFSGDASDIYPCCYKASNHPVLINFNQVGTIRLEHNGDSGAQRRFLLHMLSMDLQTINLRRWTGEAEIRTGVWRAFHHGGQARERGEGCEKIESRANAYTKACSLPLQSPSLINNLHRHVSPGPLNHLASRAQ